MNSNLLRYPLICLFALLFNSAVNAHEIPYLDIDYVGDGEKSHRLDLYLPESDAPHPLIVWTHGGAWRAGSKDSPPIMRLVEKGWAIASVEYRLSGEARFPAQMHDIKASIRFLRANADKYHLDPERFAVAGDSAGGHLAALTGMSNGDEFLEGTLGTHLDVSSDVKAIASLYGASNFMTILHQSTPHGISVRVPALELLLGDRPENVEELAKAASPVTYVNDDSPAILLIHGDQDPQMPINQSHELYGKCLERGVKATFVVIYGGHHGGPQFYDDERLALIDGFLSEAIK